MGNGMGKGWLLAYPVKVKGYPITIDLCTKWIMHSYRAHLSDSTVKQLFGDRHGPMYPINCNCIAPELKLLFSDEIMRLLPEVLQ